VDTREKILASFDGDADIVEGFFDPLLAGQAEQIAAWKRDRPLVVVVRDPESPLMTARARAEMVAALAAVDHVVIGGPLSGETIGEDRAEFMNLIRFKHGR
jgi:glycerol-3-phosphate cytidylyltransferase-like family protein